MVSLLQILVALYSVKLACGFVAPAAPTASSATRKQAATTSLNLLAVGPNDVSMFGDALSSSSHVLSNVLFKNNMDPDSAKAQFFFFFFAGSGAGGIGLTQVPKIAKEWNFVRSLSKEGPTEGGESISKSPLVSLLYPFAISQKDVLKVISKIPKGEQINQRGSSDSSEAIGPRGR